MIVDVCRITVDRDNVFTYHGFQFHVWTAPNPSSRPVDDVEVGDEDGKEEETKKLPIASFKSNLEDKASYEFVPKLAFNLEKIFHPIDYDMSNLHTATLNPFFQNFIMVSRQRDNGGFYLIFMKEFIAFDGEKQEVTPLENMEQLVDILKTKFSIHLESYDCLNAIFIAENEHA